MKKLSLAAFALAIVFTACDKTEETDSNSSSYPTDNLKVEEKQRVLLLEHTGAWCQYCPNGAEIMATMIGEFGHDVIAVANHDKDALTFPINVELAKNFPPAGFPNFFVMNADEGQQPKNAILTALAQDPILGVTHAVKSTDTSWNVYPKIEFYEDVYNEDFLVNSYLVLDEVLATSYGAIDLNQVSSVPIVGGSNPTKWLQDAAFVNGEATITSGSDYYHQENLVLNANTPNYYGIAVADVNPFGRDYIAGDILGTKNTSIVLSLPKADMSQVPFSTGLSVVTMVWRLRTDGSGAYDFVNGYMSHLTEGIN